MFELLGDNKIKSNLYSQSVQSQRNIWQRQPTKFFSSTVETLQRMLKPRRLT